MPTRHDIVERLKDLHRDSLNEWGLSAQEERFAKAYAKGKPLMDAYRAAFSVGEINTAAHYEAAMALLNKESVQARLAILKEDEDAKIAFDVDAIRTHVLKGLVKVSRDDAAPASAKVNALVWLGRIDVVDMFSKKKPEAADDSRKPDEIEAELREKLRKMLKP